MAAKRLPKFAEVLIKQRLISPEQYLEAEAHAKRSGGRPADALIRLGYATGEQVMKAVARQYGLDFCDLAEVTIPPHVVELVPESVARENQIIPLSHENNALQIVMSDPNDLDTIEKLRFILNKDIQPVLSDREDIITAINTHYGQSETESVDSMLSEFTDTQIDFTETEATGGLASGDESGMIRIWDVAMGKELRQFPGKAKEIMSIAFGKDGKLLASAGRDGSVSLWDPACGRSLRSFQAHAGGGRVVFSPDGKQLATCGTDQTVKLWEVSER